MLLVESDFQNHGHLGVAMGFLSLTQNLVIQKNAETLDDLKAGESAVILGLSQDFSYGERFTELGFTTGTNVTILRKALFGDPIQIHIRGTRYALRKSDASRIRIRKNP